MTLYEKMMEIGRSFDYDTWMAYICDGKKVGVVDFGLTEKQAKEYLTIGKKNKLRIEIAMFSHEDDGLIYG